MSLDLGALVATAGINTAPFDTAYPALLRKMSSLGVEAQKATAGTVSLDEAVAALARTSKGAAGSLDAVTVAGTKTVASEDKAAAATRGHALAIQRITTVTDPYIGSSQRVQAALLRQIAAQERVDALMESGTATTRQLAAANATLISSTRSVAAAQEATVISSSKATGAMAGTLKMAAGLGVAFGAFELIKKSIDIGKEASAFQKQMTMISTNANASTAEVKALTPAVLALAGPLASSPEDLALALYHIEQNGLRGSKALDVLTVSAKGAKVGNADLEATTNSMTAAVASGIPGVKDMDQAMGALIATVGTGDMKMTDLNEALGSGMLVRVKAYGLTLRDVGAALAVFGDNNIRGADAATMVVQAVQAMAKPAAGGKKALGDIGLSVDALRKDMAEGGLNKAILDLNDHLTAAGITGKKTGGFLLDAFGRKQAAGVTVLLEQLGRLETKYAELDKGSASFESKWDATTKTVSFAFDRIKADLEAGGIALEMKLMPAVQTAAHWLGVDLPHDISVLQRTLAPLEHEVAGGLTIAWHILADVLGVVGTGLGDVGHFLADNKTLVTATATAVGSMWLAYKGYQIAVLAIGAVRFAIASLSASGANALADIRRYGAGVSATFAGNATEAQLSAAIQRQAFVEIEASALADAAAQDRAAAIKSVAYSDTVAASTAASDAEVAAADRAAAAALAQARASQAAAAIVASSAEEAATAVNLAGDTAALGWTAMLGPLALVGVGITALTLLFHGNSSAAQKVAAANQAAKEQIEGLTDAIKQDSGAIGVNTEQYIANALHKSGAADAATKVGLSLRTLQLAAEGNAGAMAEVNRELDVWAAADKGIGSQNPTKAQKDMLALGGSWQIVKDAISGTDTNIKSAVGAYHQVNALMGQSTSAANAQAAAVAKTSAVTQIAAGVDQQYAQMLGIVVDESGNTSTAANVVAAAIQEMSAAYEDATATGSEFLSAMQTFSASEHTAADRGAMMAATLKAANGDALGFAAALTGTTTAIDSMTDAFKNQATQLTTQSADQSKAIDAVSKAHRGTETAAARVAAAEARLAQVRGNAKSTAAQIKSAEAAVVSAQNSAKNSADALGQAQTKAGKAGALAYADTERAAIIFKTTTKGVTAEINTNAKGAGDLVSQLQGLQTAAMAAASAEFQHEVATKGAKQAADDAYNIYVTKTKGALVDQATQLGLTSAQAAALATTYFGMPADVKTTIEAIGTDPVLDVLNKIGQLLATFTGQPWVTVMTAKDKATPVIDDLNNKLDFLTDRKAGPYITATDQATAVLDGIISRMGKINGAQVVAKIGEVGDLHRAHGGWAFGPGSSTSDSIPTHLSRGEFVENAAAASKFGPVLEDINSGALSSMGDLARYVNRGTGADAYAGRSSGRTSVSSSKVERHLRIDLDIHNPVRTPWTQSVSDAMSAATNVIGEW